MEFPACEVTQGELQGEYTAPMSNLVPERSLTSVSYVSAVLEQSTVKCSLNNDTVVFKRKLKTEFFCTRIRSPTVDILALQADFVQWRFLLLYFVCLLTSKMSPLFHTLVRLATRRVYACAVGDDLNEANIDRL